MMNIQQFQNNRQTQLKDFQRLRQGSDRNFLLCSNEYAQKLTQLSRSITRPPPPTPGPQRSSTVLIITRVPASEALNNSKNNDVSIDSVSENFVLF